MSIRSIVVIVASLAATFAAAAHQFWALPSSFSVATGTRLDVRLFVGDGFPGEAMGRNGPKIERFVAVGPKGEKPIGGRNGVDPAGSVTLDDPGAHLVVFRNTPSRLELDAEKFEHYLAEEGLADAIESRRQRGESSKPGRELFSRCVKSIIRVGGDGSGYDREVGLKHEIIPASDPFTLIPGSNGSDELRLRLVFEKKPEAGRRVSGRTPSDPKLVVTGTTDDNGLVTLRLPRAGVWMISAVHMEAAAAGADADWESTWASLTFEIPATEAAK